MAKRMSKGNGRIKSIQKEKTGVKFLKSNGKPRTMLSKSSYCYGLQCHKRLWMHKNQPELADEITPATQERFDEGNRVGELARAYFPGGVMVPYEGLTFSEQLHRTEQAIAAGAQVLYEATFIYDGVLVKADILRYGADGWELYEVKSATKLKPEYIDDIAVQTYVLRGAGIPLIRSYLMHIDNQYVLRGAIDAKELLRVVDVTSEINAVQPDIPGRLDVLKKVLSQQEAPGLDIGQHCRQPYPCDFMNYCWQHIPTPSVFNMGFKSPRDFTYYDQGIIAIEDIPVNAKKTEAQRIRIEAHLANTPHIRQTAVKRFLEKLRYPLCFLDFETTASAIPAYNGTHPYQAIPFQYSLHIQDKPSAAMRHVEYLADGEADPRTELLLHLLEDLPPDACVLSWNSSFENTQLRKLGLFFPDQAVRLQQIIDNMIDLADPIKSMDIYFPGFNGSWSIKNVLPVLVPELSYKELDIQSGAIAPLEWRRMIQLPEGEEKKKLREQLLTYCGLDTEAMVRIYQRYLELL